MTNLLTELLIPAGIVIATIFILLAVRNLTFRLLHRWAERTGAAAGDIVIATFKAPSVYWSVAMGLYMGITFSALPERHAFLLLRAIHVILVLSVTIATANLCAKILETHIKRSSLPIPTTGIVFGVLKGSILALGAVITLGMLGVSITPLITALGVGGLAVALALQDTLSNLFSGLHIIAARQVKPGNYIKLNTGEEGYIADITWRNTTVKTLSDTIIIVPNSKFATAVITNYDLPDTETPFSIHLTVAYSNDLDKVERVATETARKVMEESGGGVPGFLPSVRFGGFGDSGVTLSINLKAKTFADQYLLRHECVKLLLRRFREEDIEVPAPVKLLER